MRSRLPRPPAAGRMVLPFAGDAARSEIWRHGGAPTVEVATPLVSRETILTRPSLTLLSRRVEGRRPSEPRSREKMQRGLCGHKEGRDRVARAETRGTPRPEIRGPPAPEAPIAGRAPEPRTAPRARRSPASSRRRRSPARADRQTGDEARRKPSIDARSVTAAQRVATGFPTASAQNRRISTCQDERDG